MYVVISVCSRPCSSSRINSAGPRWTVDQGAVIITWHSSRIVALRGLWNDLDLGSRTGTALDHGVNDCTAAGDSLSTRQFFCLLSGSGRAQPAAARGRSPEPFIFAGFNRFSGFAGLAEPAGLAFGSSRMAESWQEMIPRFLYVIATCFFPQWMPCSRNQPDSTGSVFHETPIQEALIP